MRSKSPYFLLLSCFLASSITTKHVRGETVAKVDPKFESVCSIYLAESTIPNAGMGVFTSHAIPEGAEISSTGDGPIIVLHDILQNMGKTPPQGLGHMEYIWDATGYSPEHFEAEHSSIAQATVGALANYHPVLMNIGDEIRTSEYDDSIVDRNTDLGAGAFSYHRSKNITAGRDISAGEELFHNYGEQWLEETLRRKRYKHVARKLNYEMASNIVKGFMSDNLDDASLSAVQGIVDIYDKRTASVLPKTRLVNESVLTDSESIVINLGKASLQQRSAEWLAQNGRCMDNLVPRISTLPQAGNGAFAQRFLPEGSLVVPAPILQTIDVNYLNIKTRDGMVNNRQMLLNYCIAHEDSTMLLCPISRAILMNHCSERMNFGGECGKGVEANAKLEFDDNFDATSKEWQQKSFSEIKKEVHAGRRGLSFNVIATRDIQPGEEVFIDYGDAWEEAWKEHIRSWQPPVEYTSYMSVTKLTNDHDIRTTVELAKNPYADNVAVKCIFGALYDEHDFGSPPSNWREMSDAALIQKYSRPGGIYSISSKESRNLDYRWFYLPCDIYFHGDDDRLTVGIYAVSNDVPLIFTDYPSESVRFVSKKYTSDEHLPNSFRHPIGLSDKAMFPEQWKNLKSG